MTMRLNAILEAEIATSVAMRSLQVQPDWCVGCPGSALRACASTVTFAECSVIVDLDPWTAKVGAASDEITLVRTDSHSHCAIGIGMYI